MSTDVFGRQERVAECRAQEEVARWPAFGAKWAKQPRMVKNPSW